MNILVCNIRSFYLISKRMSPEENFNFINSFLNRFGPYVRGHGGLINKYLGAGIMALFPNASEEAITAAIEMRTELELYNTHRDNSNYIDIDIGIAIHKGPLRLGIIGEEKRLEGNVISDDVNLTDVLEKLTETLGVSIKGIPKRLGCLRIVPKNFLKRVSSSTKPAGFMMRGKLSLM